MHHIKFFSGNGLIPRAFVFDLILDCDALSNLMIVNQMQDFKGMKEKLWKS